MDITIQSHSWEESGKNYHSDFFVFVDGKPSFELSDCIKCQHYIEYGDCKIAREKGCDDKIYPFCGRVCGYFKP